VSAKPTLPAVARSRRFQQALGRRLTVLERDLPAALDHDADALHRTRVASRRLREVLPVIEKTSATAAPPLRKSRGRVRRLPRALGGVRELDVALELLNEIASGHPHLERATMAVRAEIQRERAGRYADMIRSLEDIKPGRLTRELASLTEVPNATAPRAEQQRRLHGRLLRRAAALDRAILAAGALYAFDRLHLVRIAAKKLRYVLELVAELTHVRTVRLVKKLKASQELLGRLHDLEVLAAYVRRVRELPAPYGKGRGVRGQGLIGVIEMETRELHAEYLRRTGMLHAVTAACREEISGRLR
jgi:CHAD domain-containing protein